MTHNPHNYPKLNLIYLNLLTDITLLQLKNIHTYRQLYLPIKQRGNKIVE